MNTYCSSCGYKIVYGEKRPKFCSNCGDTIGEVVGVDSDVSSVVPSVVKADVVLEGMAGGGVKLGDLMGVGFSQNTQKLNRPKPNLSDDILKQSKNDCASSKFKDINE